MSGRFALLVGVALAMPSLAQAQSIPQIDWSAVRVSGYAQADWVVFRQSSQDEVNPSTREPLNEDRFVIPSARIRANVDHGLVTGMVEIDANTLRGGQVRPIDAEVSLRWPARAPVAGEAYFQATLGLFRTPFGFDTQEVAQRRPFLGRSLFSDALFPGAYDLGLALRGGYRFFNYSLGILNGDPIGERAFPGRDPNQSKDLVFRIGVESNRASPFRVEAGFSGLTGAGLHVGTPPTKDVFVWRDVNEDGTWIRRRFRSSGARRPRRRSAFRGSRWARICV
ncbi:hypothetical protein LZC95_10040 [Pendulispora brunnea]|uniref:Uncharacterized protein n=1 Tax=Pendulispora brunnea TaxID=2905690 RepID=A0ABZ2KEU0_9BACT